MSTTRVLGACLSGGLFIGCALAAGGCAIGAPPGFSAGNTWTLPLVDPLDNGELVVPVTIKGKGPYLFAIDPDAQDTIIDERIAMEAELLTDRGYDVRIRSDDNVIRARFRAELRDIRIGNLDVEVRTAIMVPHEALAVNGRNIMGVLGRNIIADSLVLGVDRDRGIASLQTSEAFQPSAPPIPYKIDRGGDNKAPHTVVTGSVNGQMMKLEVTLGSELTRLRPDKLKELNVPAQTAGSRNEFDTTGTRRQVAVLQSPVSVAIGNFSNPRNAVGPYINQTDVASSSLFSDGVIGAEFFSPFKLAMDWNHHVMYLEPRDADPRATTKQRVERWAQFASCEHAGCVTVSMVPAPPNKARATENGLAPPSASADNEPMYVLHVAREAGPAAQLPLEVRLRAEGRNDLADLIIDLPAGASELVQPLRGGLDGVRYVVVDVNPFPAECAAANVGCIRQY